jgi:hypothetical protein
MNESWARLSNILLKNPFVMLFNDDSKITNGLTTTFLYKNRILLSTLLVFCIIICAIKIFKKRFMVWLGLDRN